MRQPWLFLLVALLSSNTAAFAAAPIILVPSGSPTLSAAMTAVPDGGIIEIAAGTYNAPAGGFTITNPNKRFTIRAAAGATVVLSGNNTQPVFRYLVTNTAQRGHIVFEDLTFANGRTTTDALAGGVLLNGGAHGSFRRCIFENNTNQAPSTGGGGGAVFTNSKAIFIDCIFRNNTAKNEGAGLRVAEGSEVWIHDSQFTNNSCAQPNHRNTAAGGGIHVGNAKLWVTNSRFEGNAAGYVGGGIYAIGSWQEPVTTPRAEVIVANSTFENNTADRDPSVVFSVPTEGGAMHAEDQATFKIYNSRFLKNTADNGGALSFYRSIGEVYAGTFLGNRQVAVGGFGGAIQAISRDTTGDGANNRRPVSLSIFDSYFQGRYDTVTTVGEEGGAIFIEGDYNRAWGQGGVTQNGTVASNRAILNVDNTAFVDLDVTSSGGGEGGAIAAVLAAATINESLFVGCDSLGTNGSGGAIRGVIGTSMNLTNTNFTRNTAALFGGALYVSGADINTNGCQFLRNEVSPGVSETSGVSFGAAIFTDVLPSIFGTSLSSGGTVANSIFSENVGLPILDVDNQGPTINDIRYNNNQFFNNTFGTTVYRDTIQGGDQAAAGLNTLTISRSSGPSTDKSPASNNTQLGSAANTGKLLAVPPSILSTTANGDASPTSEAFLVWGWAGSSATLDGIGLGTNYWGTDSTTAAVHTLDVAGTDFLATTSLAAIPAGNLSFSPASIAGGGSSTLSWSTQAGQFLSSAIDQQVSTGNVASGSTSVSANFTRPYTLVVVTEEGGDFEIEILYVDEAPPAIFVDGFESGNLSAWSLSVP